MKTIKYSGIFFLIASCCIACTEKILIETIEIFIQNETDSIIHVKLYPIRTAKNVANLQIIDYPSSDLNNLYLSSAEFDLFPPNDLGYNNRGLFLTGDLNIKPYTLAEKVFDSIYISTATTIIKFTHENVTGYAENIFSENSIWDFEEKGWIYREFLTHTSRRNYIYKFFILKDKIIIE